MTIVDYTPQWLASGLPPKNEYQLGSCVSLGIADGMQFLALRSGIARAVSQIFLHYNSGIAQYGSGYPSMRPIPNGRQVDAVCRAAMQGVASDYLLPDAICGNDDYDLCNAAQVTKPPDAAYTDAPYQKLTDYLSIGTYAQAESELAAGHPVGFIRSINNHFLMALGIDSTQRIVRCLGTGGQVGTGAYSYDEIYPVVSLRAVAFSNPPQVPLTDAMVSQLQSLLGSIPVPLTTVSTPWAAQLTALANQAQVPIPVPPPPPTASPDGTTVPPAASVSDGVATWSLGTKSPAGFIVLRNGQPVPGGGQGDQIVWKSGQIKVHNTLGDWYLWNNGWSKTTAP